MGWMNSKFSLEDLGRIRGELYKHEYQSDHGIFQDMGLIWDVPSGQLTVVAIVIHQLIGRISHSGLKDIQAVTRWVSWRVRSNKAYPMNMYNIIPPKWAMKLQSNIWLCWNMLKIVEPTIRLNYNNLQTWITNGDDSPQSFLHHSSDIVRSLWFIQTNVWGHYISLHYTTFHYTSLHYTTLHSTTLQLQLHSTTLDYTKLHYTTLHYTTLHSTTLHYITQHYLTLNDTAPQIDR